MNLKIATISAAAAMPAAPLAAQAQLSVGIGIAPPPNVTNGPAPVASGLWAPGHWSCSGGKYAWNGGRYMTPRARYYWNDGGWQHRNNGYHYVPGHWGR